MSRRLCGAVPPAPSATVPLPGSAPRRPARRHWAGRAAVHLTGVDL